jgi:hypothetical protein
MNLISGEVGPRKATNDPILADYPDLRLMISRRACNAPLLKPIMRRIELGHCLTEVEIPD